MHDPEAPELERGPGARNMMEQGLEVGRAARREAPGGTLIDLPRHQHENRLTATRDALAARPPAIYEGAFAAGPAYAEVDLLVRNDYGWTACEVKASTRAKPEYLPDLAFQVHVLRDSGVQVSRAELVHLNRGSVYPDLSHLFVHEDVTPDIEAIAFGVPEQIEAQVRALGGALPQVEIGPHCTEPRDCPFISRCWPPLPPYHVRNLYRIEPKKVEAYEQDGFTDLRSPPSGLELSLIHQRQVRAVRSGEIVVEPSLARALREYHGVLGFLDFETISLALPRFDGCRPWDQMPVQFSAHVARPDGTYAHHEWLADGARDPRTPLARAVVQACRGVDKVVAYYAGFERECLRHLARAVPDQADALEAIAERLLDLLPTIRSHVYHPEFGASFSLKKVLPALIPALGYGDLEVQDGEQATVELQRLMFKGDGMPDAERATLRRHLLAYCEQDTWAMVKLLDRLRGFAAAAQLELF
ncbi:MAG TPA: DUF2779 domain-containing protein [Gemmatimonadales bacterium]|nr:DUF2779 domain-containing protein [Gemmatimonadales bacterium]